MNYNTPTWIDSQMFTWSAHLIFLDYPIKPHSKGALGIAKDFHATATKMWNARFRGWGDDADFSMLMDYAYSCLGISI